jgi:hypothetical protein
MLLATLALHFVYVSTYQLKIILPKDGSHRSYFLKKPSADVPTVSWLQVFDHMCERLSWENTKSSKKQLGDDLSLSISCMNDYEDKGSEIIPSNMSETPVCVFVGFDDPYESLQHLPRLQSELRHVPTVITLSCSTEYRTLQKFDGFTELELQQHSRMRIENPIRAALTQILQPNDWKRQEQIVSVLSLVDDLWQRRSSDDILFMLLTLIDTFTSKTVKSVQAVTSPENTGWREVIGIVFKDI